MVIDCTKLFEELTAYNQREQEILLDLGLKVYEPTEGYREFHIDEDGNLVED